MRKYLLIFLLIFIFPMFAYTDGGETTADGYSVDYFDHLGFRGLISPSFLSQSGQAIIYYDSAEDKLYLSTNGGAFAEIGAGLTQEQVEDFAGGMWTGNTETLISISYQDGDGTIDAVVDNDLSHYDNSTSAFLTSETDDQTIDVFSITDNTLSLSLEDDGEDSKTVDLSPYLDNTDAQDLSIDGNTLSLSGDASTVDLSGYLDNTDTQDLALEANSLSLTDGGSVDLSGYLDNTDTQDLSLEGNTLSLVDGGSVDLSGYLDDTDTDDQGFDVSELDGTTLKLSLDDDGEATKEIDLSSLQDGTGTDDQTIDGLSLDGTTLHISLEDDGEADQTVDLAGLQDGTGTDDQNASEVSVSTTNFGTNFANDTDHDTVQELMDIVDDLALGGASEVNVELKPQQAKLPSNPAETAVIDASASGWKLLFDDTTQESASWEFVLDDDYGGGTLYCDVYFSMASGEANEVQWECYVMAYTPATDTADWDTDSYDTENVGVTTVASTAGRVYKQTITLTNADSATAGDMIRIKISTDSDDATNDDASGDRELRYVIIRN